VKRYSTFLLTALLCLSSLTAWANPAVTKAHKTTHKIEMPSLLGSGGSCSGTAIGPHALLTASHCVSLSAVLTVDGEDAHIAGLMSDGLDHSIYLLEGVEFKDYAEVDLDSKLTQGDSVFVLGNPSHFKDMYRKGYVSGYDAPEKAEPESDSILDMFGLAPKKKKKHTDNDTVQLTYFDFNGFFGDSGSAIFDEQGKIVAVTSIIAGDENNGMSIKFMGAYELRLTPEQLKSAREFAPKN
jgi:V8-like Glu-specific endopeptidase